MRSKKTLKIFNMNVDIVIVKLSRFAKKAKLKLKKYQLILSMGELNYISFLV